MIAVFFAIAIIATAFLAFFLGTAVAYHAHYRQARGGQLTFGREVFFCRSSAPSPYTTEH